MVSLSVSTEFRKLQTGYEIRKTVLVRAAAVLRRVLYFRGTLVAFPPDARPRASSLCSCETLVLFRLCA